MTDKELVERLRMRADGMMDEWDSILCNCSELVTAANRIEQLHTELTKEKIDNTNLIGELATVAAERDRYKAGNERLKNEEYAVCTYLAEMFDSPCNYTPTDENMMHFCGDDCGQSDITCWGRVIKMAYKKMRGLEGNA